MDKIRVDGANGLRFSARRTKGCFTPGTGSPLVNTTATSCTDSIMKIPKSEINPNKAVFTIDSKTSQILIVNHKASELLGFSAKELCEMEFSNLLVNKNKCHVSALAEGQLNSEDGRMVLLSGKVIEMKTKAEDTVAVSLWIRQIDKEGRSLAVAEPVERRVAHLTIDSNGVVTEGDFEALLLFQLDTVDDFKGIDVTTLVPAIRLPDADLEQMPKNVFKQKATGRTKEGAAFPLCLLIERQEPSDSEVCYRITIWVFTNLSGLIVIEESGLIESCNHHFSMLMFGYAQTKIIGQHVSKLIPNFGQELISRSRNATISSLDNEESETETDPVFVERTDCTDQMKICFDFSSSKVNHSIVSELSDDYSNIKSLSSDTRSINEDNLSKMNSDHQMVKSVSENILFQENFENNRNLANKLKETPTLSYNKQNIKPIPTNSNDLNEVIDNNLTDNDLLTPVNDTDFYLTQSQSNSLYSCLNHHQYVSGDSGNPNSSQKPVNSSNSVIEMSEGKFLYSSSPIKGSLVNDGSTSNSIRMQNPLSEHLSLTLPESLSTNPSRRFFAEGKFKGEAIHADGNVLDVVYTVSSQLLPSGRVYCVWISRDPETEFSSKEGDEDEENNQNLTLTFNSVNSTVENSLGQAIKISANQNLSNTNANLSNVKTNSRPNSMSLLSQCEDDQIKGEFCKNYTTLKQIGKGAYGYVKMAYRNSDRLLVIAKFILKEKLCAQFMVRTEDNKEIPMEIYLLTTVKHPNIVSVLDVFENEKFFQLVMEKHGSGMDLFEFIDRLPVMDEKLGSFIFRQIAYAVDYLHSLKILHRDIKDENIIIDQNFHVKLIDFGSATFMEEGKMFSTFFGTTEYCSPEVLAGNKYAGPELEMWSLGVTLYVITFFENPFVDIEETLHADLIMPHSISPNLDTLLKHMLDKNPRTRCTMRELLDSPWMKQDINSSMFNFSWVVPCEPFESNPEKYFNGQTYSSGTILSTTSPHDSLSLADADSMNENDDDDFIKSDEEFGDDLSKDQKENSTKDSFKVLDISNIKEINLNNKDQVSSSDQRRRSMPPVTDNFGENLPQIRQNSDVISDPYSQISKCLRKEWDKSGDTSDFKSKCYSGKSRFSSASRSRHKKSSKVFHSPANIDAVTLIDLDPPPINGDSHLLANATDLNATMPEIEQQLAQKVIGSLVASKSENNLFETKGDVKADTLTVLSSMRNLNVDNFCSSTYVMNDLSKTQVLTQILSSDDVHLDGNEKCYIKDSSFKNRPGVFVTENGVPELDPSSSNRSNLRILSVSYNHSLETDEEEEGEEDNYEDEVWEEDVEADQSSLILQQNEQQSTHVL